MSADSTPHNIQASDDLDGLRLLIATAEANSLPDDYEAKVTIGFMRGLSEQLEEARIWKATAEANGADYRRLKEQLETLTAERDRLREGVNDAADILDVIGKWFSAGADTENMGVILDDALPLIAKWETKLAAVSSPAKEPSA